MSTLMTSAWQLLQLVFVTISSCELNIVISCPLFRQNSYLCTILNKFSSINIPFSFVTIVVHYSTVLLLLTAIRSQGEIIVFLASVFAVVAI